VLQAELLAERKSRVSTEQQAQRIAEFLDYGNWLTVRPDGPLWSSDNVLKAQLREMLVPVLDGKVTIH
jgi:hypothetical protein